MSWTLLLVARGRPPLSRERRNRNSPRRAPRWRWSRSRRDRARSLPRPTVQNVLRAARPETTASRRKRARYTEMRCAAPALALALARLRRRRRARRRGARAAPAGGASAGRAQRAGRSGAAPAWAARRGGGDGDGRLVRGGDRADQPGALRRGGRGLRGGHRRGRGCPGRLRQPRRGADGRRSAGGGGGLLTGTRSPPPRAAARTAGRCGSTIRGRGRRIWCSGIVGLAVALDRDGQPRAAHETMRRALALDATMAVLAVAALPNADLFFVPRGRGLLLPRPGPRGRRPARRGRRGVPRIPDPGARPAAGRGRRGRTSPSSGGAADPRPGPPRRLSVTAPSGRRAAPA